MSGRSLGMEGNTNTQTETTNMEQVGNLTFGSAGTGDDGTKNAIGCLQWFLTGVSADIGRSPVTTIIRISLPSGH